jgi:hypothetical protein
MNEALAQSLTSIIAYLGATPILLFAAVMGLGPWIAMIWITRQQDKRLIKVFERQDIRFEQVVRMYEDNVDLVTAHQNLAVSQRETNEKLIDLVAVSTGTQQTLVDYIKNNLFCPLVKQRTRPDKILEAHDGQS